MPLLTALVVGLATVQPPQDLDLPALPVAPPTARPDTDHLLDPTPFVARVLRSADAREVVLDNGLVRRTWRLVPNGACVAFDDLMTGESLLRSVRPEARVTLDGTEYDVGGLVGQPNHAFLTPAWLEGMTADPAAFRLVGFETGTPAERFGWERRRHAAPDVVWPPRGVRLDLIFEAPDAAAWDGAPPRVTVHYELYDGLPLMSKWLSVENRHPSATVRVDRFEAEILAIVEQRSWAETHAGVQELPPRRLRVETDFAFASFDARMANSHVVHWTSDPLYTSQVDWERRSPCLLSVAPTYGPAQDVAPGATFETFRVFELVHDDEDRERQGLAVRRMYRTLAPWVTENPLTHHLLSADPDVVTDAIDRAAEVGFEAIILSFGSGFDLENTTPEHLTRWKAVADHADANGIELGGYSLFSSRFVGDDHMVISPDGQRPTHGRCPAVTSAWGQGWLATIRRVFEETGFDQFENDGPYPGDVDTVERLPFQRGEADSRWVQWRQTTELYGWMRERGIYINAPDYYYLNGTNKCGMGYREVNWSLPRAEQVIHTRQNIFDGTWEKTPSMGWMHVPLAEYQGGGAAATIEPLDEHLDHYVQMLRSNLALGVQAHYRGPRLFDTERTRDAVAAQVAWFKRYRDVLEADLVHGRRADGRDLDWMIHVAPHLEERGMVCVFNPLDHEVTRELRFELYYTGLVDRAQVAREGRSPQTLPLRRDGSLDLTVTVPAGGMTWFVVRAAEGEGR